MKKIFFLSILLTCLSAQVLLAQRITGGTPEELKRVATGSKKTVLDTCIFAVQYRMTSVANIKAPQRKTENYMLLQIGKRISKFSDFFLLKRDSLFEVYAAQKMGEIEAINKVLPMCKGTTTLNIFKNHQSGKITTIDAVPFSGSYKYMEEKEKPNWKIEEGKLTVCGYECKKATATFRGRNYTAWYAPKIAVSDGPWKFWGLPGLILKISDDQEHYVFECAAIEKPRYISKIYLLDRDYFNTTKTRFNEALKRFYENPGGTIQASGVVKSGLPDKIAARPYNPIELSE